MSEREPHAEHDAYWQHDLAIGEGRFYRDNTYTIRLQLHHSEERISWTDEIVSLSPKQKRERRRAYFHGRPYHPGPRLHRDDCDLPPAAALGGDRGGCRLGVGGDAPRGDW